MSLCHAEKSIRAHPAISSNYHGEFIIPSHFSCKFTPASEEFCAKRKAGVPVRSRLTQAESLVFDPNFGKPEFRKENLERKRQGGASGKVKPDSAKLHEAKLISDVSVGEIAAVSRPW